MNIVSSTFISDKELLIHKDCEGMSRARMIVQTSDKKYMCYACGLEVPAFWKLYIEVSQKVTTPYVGSSSYLEWESSHGNS